MLDDSNYTFLNFFQSFQQGIAHQHSRTIYVLEFIYAKFQKYSLARYSNETAIIVLHYKFILNSIDSGIGGQMARYQCNVFISFHI